MVLFRLPMERKLIFGFPQWHIETGSAITAAAPRGILTHLPKAIMLKLFIALRREHIKF